MRTPPPEQRPADLLLQIVRAAPVVKDGPPVGEREHPAAHRRQPLDRLEHLHLFPAAADAVHGGLGIHIHQDLHVRHRQETLDDPVRTTAEPVREVGHGHDVPDEDHIVVPPAPPPAHDTERVEDVRDVEQGGQDHVQSAVPAEERQLEPPYAGGPVGVGYDQNSPALRLQLVSEDPCDGALPGPVHPVDYVPCHGIRAPAGPSRTPPQAA